MRAISIVIFLFPVLTSCQKNTNLNDGSLKMPLPPALDNPEILILEKDSIEYNDLVLNLENLLPISDSICAMFENHINTNVQSGQLAMSEKYLNLVLDKYFSVDVEKLMRFLIANYNLKSYHVSPIKKDFMTNYKLLKYLAEHYEFIDIIRGIESSEGFIEIENEDELERFSNSMTRTIAFSVYSKISTDLYVENQSKLYEYIDWKIKYYAGANESKFFYS